MNILTFDIEEWSIAHNLGKDEERLYHSYDETLDFILTLLNETSTKATFFCLGDLALNFPYVVKKIHLAGHEIGCHSNNHQWLNRISRNEVIDDTRRAVYSLEDLIGEKVTSYRAPAFSIGENNKWVFEILWECGIRKDASIFPANRDIGGFINFGTDQPCIVKFNGCKMKEFPIRTASLLRKPFVFSGGGYFRISPIWLIDNQLKNNQYTMFYFHIADLIKEKNRIMSRKNYEEYFRETGTLKRRIMRWIRSNAKIGDSQQKLCKIIHNNDLLNLAQADLEIDWTQATKIIL